MWMKKHMIKIKAEDNRFYDYATKAPCDISLLCKCVIARMVVKAISQKSIARNGLGAFIFPCKKITLQYCNWGGSSQGMRDLLVSKRLDLLGQENPHTQFEILRKSGHPLLRAQYTNGREKVICVRNLNIDNVENKLKLLKDSSGDILRRRTKNDNVETLNNSVRGVWSPLHSSLRYRI